MAYTSPRTWVTGELVTAAQMNAHVRDNVLDLDRRTEPSSASVATSETTASTSFTDLATAGPAVTVTTGTECLVVVSSYMANNTAGSSNFMAYAVSGATTVAAADANARQYRAAANNADDRGSRVFHVTGLTAGSNTFTAKYRVNAGTGTFQERTIVAIPLGAA